MLLSCNCNSNSRQSYRRNEKMRGKNLDTNHQDLPMHMPVWKTEPKEACARVRVCGVLCTGQTYCYPIKGVLNIKLIYFFKSHWNRPVCSSVLWIWVPCVTMILTMTSYMWDAWANVCTSLFKLADTSNTLAQIHANKQTSMSAQRVFFSFICGQQTSNNAKSFFHDIDLFEA